MTKVLVTRAKEQADEFAYLLKNYGFKPVIFPVIAFEPPEDISIVNRSIQEIESYEWLIFTSTNGVRFFIAALARLGKSVNNLEKIKICTVGPKTAEVAKDFDLNVSLMPESYHAEGVLNSFESININNRTILFPRAEKGNKILPEGLKKMGAKIDMVPFYRTVKPVENEDELTYILNNGIDVITFTSSSTVDNFLSILGNKSDLLKGMKIACISKITAEAVKRHGLGCDIIANKNKTDSLANAIKQYWL